MSKRTRGSRTARTRPAARPAPAPQRAARPADTAPDLSAASLESDVEGAAEREWQEARREQPAARNGGAGRAAPGRAGAGRQGGRSGGILAAKAADEYVYVSRDLRRIARFAGSIAAVMVALWLLIDVTKIITY